MYSEEERKEIKVETIKDVEEQFIIELEYNSGYIRDALRPVIKFCCDDQETEILMRMADAIEKIPFYSILEYRNIIVVLIFVYYGLTILDPHTDFLRFINMEENLLRGDNIDKERSIDLYFAITAGEIDPSFNGNLGLSSEIRKYFLFKMGGSKRRQTPKRKWSRKYKLSINCKRPKGFSQKQYCKYGRKTKSKLKSKK